MPDWREGEKMTWASVSRPRMSEPRPSQHQQLLQHQQQLDTALRRGLRVVAIGGSVTASYGGCWGHGCHTDVGFAKPSNAASQTVGFLSKFMRTVAATFPHANHSLSNRAVGGNGAGLVLNCVESFVPIGTDLVVADFHINDGDAHVHSKVLSALQALSPPPLVLVLANFFWCRNPNGSDARYPKAPTDAPVRAACAAANATARIQAASANGHLRGP